MADNNLNGKKVLVTGGAGLIGSHLVDALVLRGADVVILDNLDKQTHPFGKPDWINKEAQFIEGDVRSYDDLRRALSGVEYVFHQAAFGGFTSELSHYIDANATGTARIFEVIVKDNLPVKKIVAASSQAVYGEGTYLAEDGSIFYPEYLRPVAQLREGRWEIECPRTGKPMKPLKNKEDRPLYTETIYGISKLAEEKLILGLGRKFEVPTVALRYAVTYGPRQSIYNPYTGVVSIFSTQLLNDCAPIVYEDGEQTRDYLYVADNVAANILVMENEEANYKVFNVGRGEFVTVKRLVKALAERYHKNIDPQCSGEYRPWDVRHFVHDSSAINKLGFKAEVSLEAGLDQYVEWIGTQGKVKEYFSTARDKMRKAGIVFCSNSN
ncbi:MAG: NAD-dependent epimerase/dehydratase family protein [Gammaproteobacteria bacterium]|jgi:dTDP-L-rhamnose 4-epimerase